MMRPILICMVLTTSLGSPALAHNGAGQINSFTSGIAHPLSGVDHVLAMGAIGLWGVLAGGRAIWAWPVAFMGTMLVGFIAATLGSQVPLVESAISLSIVVLGLLVALGAETPIWLGAAVVGLFAFFHGHAHGTEAGAASSLPYAAGLALSTAGLNTAGIVLGVLAQGSIGKVAARAIGGVAALGGVIVIAGLT